MDVNALRLLYDNIHDFKTTALLVAPSPSLPAVRSV